MLCFSRGLESGNKVASLYYSGMRVDKKQDMQLQRLVAGYWFVYRECMNRLKNGMLNVDEVERFAKMAKKIEGRELLSGIPSSVIYQACADAGYDRLYGKKRRRDCSFSLSQTGYVFLKENKIRMRGVDGDIRLNHGFSSIPVQQNNTSIDWIPSVNQWVFGFWSSTVA